VRILGFRRQKIISRICVAGLMVIEWTGRVGKARLNRKPDVICCLSVLYSRRLPVLERTASGIGRLPVHRP
jgi:hypothetical protein